MPLLTISELKKATREHSPQEAAVHAQIEKITRKDATNGKPFYEVVFRDGSESMTLRGWADTAAFEASASLQAGNFVSLEGAFSHTAAFGMDARGWEMSLLQDAAVDALLEGSAPRRELLER
ncbi:MAG: hypothetical protein NTW91_10310, partial [Verrucomicrobia bacterium]|nr:hypothetical protein [Verrucomicrobiota bacterium]